MVECSRNLLKLKISDIVDTGGCEALDIVRSLTYQDVDVFVICFSLDKFHTLENVHRKFIPEIRIYSQAHIVLVGTKLDLENKNKEISAEVARTREEAAKMRGKIKIENYIECSAYSTEGVSQVFEAAVRVAMKRKQCNINQNLNSC